MDLRTLCGTVVVLALLSACCGVSAPMAEGPDSVDAQIPKAGADAGEAGPDAALALEDAGETLDAAADAGPDVALEPALFAVEPGSGGASVATDVLLRGEGFWPVKRVEVGGQPATQVERLDSRTVRARFEAVALREIGKKPVRLTFENDESLELPEGFEYLFDEDPIVFVHGFMLSPFELMVQRFKDAGYPTQMLWRISYSDSTGSSLQNQQELAAFVADVLQQTGAPKVDLVIHSMGGLSSRLYLQNGGDAFVRDYVSIAGAHHGTSVAYAYPSDGAREMRPPYACEGGSLNDLQYRLNGCLNDTGRTWFVDETSHGLEDGGGVAYLSISSEHDEFILPSESSCLNQRKKGDCSHPVNVRVRWLGHATILTDGGVFDTTSAHLRKRNRSRP